MKLILLSIITIFLYNCSFDDKSGIWKNENQVSKQKKSIFSGFEKLNTSKEKFNQIIPLKNVVSFRLDQPINNSKWNDIFFDKSNNYKNFKYNNNNNILFRSKKLSSYNLSKYILLDDNNIISSDKKGNIFIYSIDQKKIISKFNFYKKNYKNIDKKLNLIINNHTIYVSDNIGYLYSYDYKKDKILWAKNYKIPFRSNLKLSENQIIAANQNNDLIFYDIYNGDIIKLIPTEGTTIKNRFVNNLSMSKDSIFFLNTYGSFYSIDKKTMKINWFLNLNRNLDQNPSNLFSGNEIINHGKNIIISTNDATYILDANNGKINFKKNFSSNIKPIVSDNFLFLVSQSNLLICVNLIDNKILYSYNINKKVSEYLNTKKEKNINFKNLFIVNNKLFIFLKNSNILQFDLNGNLSNISKLPVKIKSYPIFFESLIVYTDYRNRISIVN